MTRLELLSRKQTNNKRQCAGIAKSTGVRCRHYICSNNNETSVYCRQHLNQKDQDLQSRLSKNEHSQKKTRKKGAMSKFLHSLQRILCMSNPTLSKSNQPQEKRKGKQQQQQQQQQGAEPVANYAVSAASRTRYTKLLAAELNKPISKADEAGYIYIYEILPPDQRMNTCNLPDNEREILIQYRGSKTNRP